MPIGREARFIEIITITKFAIITCSLPFDDGSFNGSPPDERPQMTVDFRQKFPGLGAGSVVRKTPGRAIPAGRRAGTLLQPEGEILL
jgi:hypothetical protein